MFLEKKNPKHTPLCLLQALPIAVKAYPLLRSLLLNLDLIVATLAAEHKTTRAAVMSSVKQRKGVSALVAAFDNIISLPLDIVVGLIRTIVVGG